MLRYIVVLVLVLTSCGGNASERRGFGNKKELSAPFSLTSYAETPPTKEGFFDGGGFFGKEKSRKKRSKKVTVALLLPLSGEASDLGKAMLDAAQMALYDANYSGLVIQPVDTQGAAFIASQAAEQAIKNDAQLILGPVFSSTTQAVIPVAEKANINVISLSNDRALSGKGVYLMGFMPDQQIQRVATYALQKGLSDFAAIVPNNSYGSMAADEYTETVSNYGGNLHRTEYYLSGHQGLRLTLQRIVHLVLSSLPQSKGNNEMFSENERENALFIPEGGESLSRIVSLVQSKHDKNVQLLGTGQWDDSSVIMNPDLRGGWFAGTEPSKRKRFEQRFDDIYGYRPPRIASLAYDAVAFTVTLMRYEGKAFTRKALTNPRGFSGIDGIFRLRRDGISERGLAILEIGDSGVKVIDPAPQKFFNF